MEQMVFKIKNKSEKKALTDFAKSQNIEVVEKNAFDEALFLKFFQDRQNDEKMTIEETDSFLKSLEK